MRSSIRDWMGGRWLLAPLLAGALLALVALPALPAGAQTPGGPGPGAGQGGQFGPFRGAPPSAGGFGLMQMDQDRDRDHVFANLRLQDCDPRMLAVTIGGRWHTFIPGAPDFVNRDFPARLQAGDPFLAHCSGERPDARVTEADDGQTVTLQTGDRLRVVLVSNPTTGFSWATNPAPSAAVLLQDGESFFVADSEALGSGGVEVFDFVAQGAGQVTLTLEYARPFEAGSVTDTWSVTVVVQ